MGLIGYVLVGLVIGVIARLLMPGRDPIGIVGTILIGIVGAVAGSYLWVALFGDTKGVEWIGGVIVAMVLLYAYRRMSLGRGTV
ncbi:MAG: GlsB/YeaQ/YmgE family stress response membrane protein [Actinomycetota bacterium]|nr:GlsB/YeaQ/YmgE family stress response membrane protein [Actinomycetota bacterium]